MKDRTRAVSRQRLFFGRDMGAGYPWDIGRRARFTKSQKLKSFREVRPYGAGRGNR
jgi:hypothetical protein